MFCSKYALTTGIKEFVPTKAFSDSDYVYDGPWAMLKIGREAFNTLNEAIADAENRRVAKIDSLRKQIKKLEALTFD
jgi:hypothetical protein